MGELDSALINDELMKRRTQSAFYILTCHMILRTTRSTFAAVSMRVDKSNGNDDWSRHFIYFFDVKKEVKKEKEERERKGLFIYKKRGKTKDGKTELINLLSFTLPWTMNTIFFLSLALSYRQPSLSELMFRPFDNLSTRKTLIFYIRYCKKKRERVSERDHPVCLNTCASLTFL